MEKIDLSDFNNLIISYRAAPDVTIPSEKFTWKPVVAFYVSKSLAYYKPWLDENNIKFLYLYHAISFKDENEALLFKFRFTD